MSKPLDLEQFEGHTEGEWNWVELFEDKVWDGVKSQDYIYRSLRTIKYYPKGTFSLPMFICDAEEELENISDMKLIAAAPTLLAEVKALRAENERLKHLAGKLLLQESFTITLAHAHGYRHNPSLYTDKLIKEAFAEYEARQAYPE